MERMISLRLRDEIDLFDDLIEAKFYIV